MKKTFIFCAIIITTLLLDGCGRNNTLMPEASATPDTVIPSATTDTAPSDTADVVPEIPSPPPTQVSGNNTVYDSQTSSTTEYAGITEEEAKQIALSHAGLTAEQVTFTQSNVDIDDNRQHYDIEFYTTDYKEYDYEIDRYSGDILEWDIDIEEKSPGA